MPTIALAFIFLMMPTAGIAQSGGFTHKPPPHLTSGEDFVVNASVVGVKGFRRARVRYRSEGDKKYEKADFREGKPSTIRAVIPAQDIVAPGVEYFIVMQTEDNQVQVVFGSAADPHRLPVVDPQAKQPMPEDEKATVESSSTEKPLPVDKVEPEVQPSQIRDPKQSREKRRTQEQAPAQEQEQAQEEISGEVESEIDSDSLVFSPKVIYGGGLRRADGPPIDDLEEIFRVYGAHAPAIYEDQVRDAFEDTSIFSQTWTRRDFEKFGAETLGDVLKHFFGAETSRHILGYDQVAMRSLRRDARVVVLLDGHQINNPYDGRVLWNLPVALVDRIKVETGPGTNSADLAGGSAVVHISTRQETGLDAKVFGHSYAGGGASLSGATALGPVHLSGGGHLEAEEGPKLIVDEDAYSFSEFSREEEDMQTHARALRGMGTGRLSYVFGGDGNNEVYGQTWLQGEWRGPYLGAFDTVGPASQLVWMTSGTAVGLHANIGDSIALDADTTLDHHHIDQLIQLTPEDFETSDRNEDGLDETFPSGVFYRRMVSIVSHRATTKLGIHPFSGNRIESGVVSAFSILPPGGYALESNRTAYGVPQALGPIEDFALAEVEPCLAFSLAVPLGGACRLSTTVFLNDTQKLFNRLRLSGGLRLQTFSDVEFDWASHINPYLEMSWFVTKHLLLQTKALTGLVPPTLEEKFDQRAALYSDLSRGDYTGKADLRDEAYREVDAGLQYHLNFLQTSHEFRFLGYFLQVTDAIEKVPVNGIIEEISNAGDYFIGGLETAWESKFGDRTSVFLNASWFRSYWYAPPDLDPEEPHCSMQSALMRDFAFGEDVDGCTLMTDVPQLRANVGAVADLGGLGTLGSVVHLGVERRGNSRATLERIHQYRIPAYSLLNIVYQSPAAFDLVGFWIRGTNLLNHPAQDAVPRPDRMPGLLPREGLRVLLGIYFQI